jgi:hypothetical protein
MPFLIAALSVLQSFGGASSTRLTRGWLSCVINPGMRCLPDLPAALACPPACRPTCLKVMALVQVRDNLDQYGVGQVGGGADADAGWWASECGRLVRCMSPVAHAAGSVGYLLAAL